MTRTVVIVPRLWARPIIVTRHRGAQDWVRKHVGALADVAVVERITIDAARGRDLVGNVPLHIAAVARRIYAIQFIGVPPRGAEYSARDMEAAGAHLVAYRVFDERDVSVMDLDAALTSQAAGLRHRLGDDRVRP